MKNFKFAFALLFCFVSTMVIAAEPKKPFDGVSLKGWKAVEGNTKNTWIVGRAALDSDNELAIAAKPLVKKDKKIEAGDLINFVEGNWTEEPRGGVDLFSEEVFGDCVIDLEFMVSKNANSGIYVMGEYEVQVLDSWGHDTMTQG
ncbi:MAG: family 16 glycoside hydrolase, partial [Thermoguttaceae bacterium]